MAEQNVITSMLDDFAREKPISTAICIGQDLSEIQQHSSIQWEYFSVSECLNQPFVKRYDLAWVTLNRIAFTDFPTQAKVQCLVKLRDLLSKRLIVFASAEDEQLLRSLGFSQLIMYGDHEQNFAVWQFNILDYKQIPDWLNAKYWANPENWNKYRW